MTLAETQALFHEAITGPSPLAAERLRACFAGTAALPAEDRVAIYAGMYLARLVDGLRQTFPNLARLLGEEELAALAGDYLARHPSEHHDLAQVGRRLAAFLREHPDPERPDLADLAELEWARQEVFFEAPAEPLDREALARLDGEAFIATRLELTPALRWLALEHDVVAAWRRLEAGEAAGPVAPGPIAVVIWRSGHEVAHAAIGPEEATALAVAGGGGTLAEICGCFEGSGDPAGAAHRALSSWLAEGWITGVKPG